MIGKIGSSGGASRTSKTGKSAKASKSSKAGKSGKVKKKKKSKKSDSSKGINSKDKFSKSSELKEDSGKDKKTSECTSLIQGLLDMQQGTEGGKSEGQGGAEKSKSSSGAGSKPNDQEMKLFNMINQERQKKGLKPLQFDESAYKASKGHSDNMSKNKFFDHKAPDGKKQHERLKQSGANPKKSAENIASGGNLSDMKNNWMKSPGHKKNIMDPKLTKGAVAITGGKATQTFMS